MNTTVETFRRSYRDPLSRTYPPSGTFLPDLIWTRFRPDFNLISDLKSPSSGRNQVEIGSKSGPNQVRAEGCSWVGAGGVGPAKRVPVAPPESLYTTVIWRFNCPDLFRFEFFSAIIIGIKVGTGERVITKGSFHWRNP